MITKSDVSTIKARIYTMSTSGMEILLYAMMQLWQYFTNLYIQGSAVKIFFKIGLIFSVVGLALLIGAGFAYQDSKTFLEQAVKTTGTVIYGGENDRSSRSYRPAVLAFVDQHGKEVQFSTGDSTLHTVGEEMQILYLPGDPERAKINQFFALWSAVIIVGGLGLVFFLVGTASAVLSTQGSRREKYLSIHGVPIDTRLEGIEINQSLSVNGKHPYQIITQWLNPETNKIHIFKSKNLWFNPSQYVKSNQIRVLIQPGNPKRYAVDVSFLPEIAE